MNSRLGGFHKPSLLAAVGLLFYVCAIRLWAHSGNQTGPANVSLVSGELNLGKQVHGAVSNAGL